MENANHLENGAPEKLVHSSQSEPEPSKPPKAAVEIKIGKAPVPAETDGREFMIEIFTMALGDQVIYLLPQKTWSQLDLYKWRVQGRLPGTPAGLEVGIDHVKMAGESVSTSDPEGCAKLERAFNEWLAMETEALELAMQKAQSSKEQNVPVSEPEEGQVRFQVELDKAGQPHIRCLEGKEVAADVALTVPGIESLFTHGLMRRPGAWKLGALRDWIELDGEIIKLRNGKEDLATLEKVLNERYLPVTEPGSIRDVRVYSNPASPSGFDIQFSAEFNGLAENRRRHLDAEAMEVLSDPKRCRILRKGIVVKFTAPDFIFKQKTTDGGEKPLDPIPENTVEASGEDGKSKVINLSQPVSHLGLGATELMTVFNHPALNRRARKAADSPPGTMRQAA